MAEEPIGEGMLGSSTLDAILKGRLDHQTYNKGQTLEPPLVLSSGDSDNNTSGLAELRPPSDFESGSEEVIDSDDEDDDGEDDDDDDYDEEVVLSSDDDEEEEEAEDVSSDEEDEDESIEDADANDNTAQDGASDVGIKNIDEEDDKDVLGSLGNGITYNDGQVCDSSVSSQSNESQDKPHISTKMEVSETQNEEQKLDLKAEDELTDLKLAEEVKNLHADLSLLNSEASNLMSGIQAEDVTSDFKDDKGLFDFKVDSTIDDDHEPSSTLDTSAISSEKLTEGKTGSGEVPAKKKRKRKKKGEGESVGKKRVKKDNNEKKEKKPKGEKKRKKKDKSESPDNEKTKKKTFERKNIRKILRDDQLEAETLAAQKEEEERKQRLQELREQMLQQAAEARASKMSELRLLLETTLQDGVQGLEDGGSPADTLPEAEFGPEKDEESKEDGDLLMLGDKSEAEKPPADVIDISSSEDEIVMVGSDQEEERGEDPNNSGCHVNDSMNQPDKEGRVLVNVGHPPEEPDLFLAPQLARAVKPHQIGGIRFLYDNLVESLERYKNSNGFGCILAHSMGLGKTLQIISFTDVFLRYTAGKTVLCIVPINTLQNWISEFNNWLPAEMDPTRPDMINRKFPLHWLNDNHKTTQSRAKIVKEWASGGGILLLGYEMYRLLCSRKIAPTRSRKKKGNNDPVVIDVDEEDKNKAFMMEIHTALMRPGPDMVICDEGHRIKNSHAGISQALKNIRTKRRVVLTGYPLQNNLLEYWCMVDFVRPNFLGTKTEFCNMFERPIMNGQCMDSTPQDRRLMKFRAHVLHSLLEGFVQRRGHKVLQLALPPKEEYVLLVRMSDIQKSLYRTFMESIKENGLLAWANSNPLKAFAVCCKIWNHPDVLHSAVKSIKNNAPDDDLDIDDSEGTNKGQKKNKSNQKQAGAAAVTATQAKVNQTPTAQAVDEGLSALADKKEQQVITYDWAVSMMKDYKDGVLENGGKMLLMMALIDESLRLGDKLLVFSQSLFTLNLIEEFLNKTRVPLPDETSCWVKNKNYFRLDGSTSGTEREKLINQFNAPDNDKIHLFLLSTRAGCLGINLVGANRVVVFDASWNPCHDAQAVCRVYRYGQTKPCYVYRLVTDNTMEKKIYDRQINKQGMSDRVVDELQPQNHFSKKQVDHLMHYEYGDVPQWDWSEFEGRYDDLVLNRVVQLHHRCITKIPFTHESLLLDRKDQKLTKAEKKLAKQSYEQEKKLNISYSRPSYTQFYPKGMAVQYPPVLSSRCMSVPNPKRPVASVRPMMSTPLPMHTVDQQGYPGVRGQLERPGVTVQQIQTTTDIMIPGTASMSDAGRIPAGENVLVIKTPKGVYIRTKEGKIFAVRSGPKTGETTPTNPASTQAPAQPPAGTISTTTVRGPGGQPLTHVVIKTQGKAGARSLGPFQPNIHRVRLHTTKVKEPAPKPATQVSGQDTAVSSPKATSEPGTKSPAPKKSVMDSKAETSANQGTQISDSQSSVGDLSLSAMLEDSPEPSPSPTDTSSIPRPPQLNTPSLGSSLSFNDMLQTSQEGQASNSGTTDLSSEQKSNSELMSRMLKSTVSVASSVSSISAAGKNVNDTTKPTTSWSGNTPETDISKLINLPQKDQPNCQPTENLFSHLNTTKSTFLPQEQPHRDNLISNILAMSKGSRESPVSGSPVDQTLSTKVKTVTRPVEVSMPVSHPADIRLPAKQSSNMSQANANLPALHPANMNLPVSDSSGNQSPMSFTDGNSLSNDSLSRNVSKTTNAANDSRVKIDDTEDLLGNILAGYISQAKQSLKAAPVNTATSNSSTPRQSAVSNVTMDMGPDSSGDESGLMDFLDSPLSDPVASGPNTMAEPEPTMQASRPADNMAGSGSMNYPQQGGDDNYMGYNYGTQYPMPGYGSPVMPGMNTGGYNPNTPQTMPPAYGGNLPSYAQAMAGGHGMPPMNPYPHMFPFFPQYPYSYPQGPNPQGMQGWPYAPAFMPPSYPQMMNQAEGQNPRQKQKSSKEQKQ